MTSQDTLLNSKQLPLRPMFIAAVVIWTMVAIGVWGWEVVDNRSFVTANAKAIARASYEKDLAFRRWAAKHGGVYVPATADTPPNPYLQVPERDIVTPTGRALTLMNPAYMTRQVYEIMRQYPDSPQGHITSLNPIRPENAPDAWERKVLALFDTGTTEFSEYQEINGARHFRYMHALKTEKPCLKCHAAQGYREGDVRGGISVTIPVAELEQIMHGSNVTHFVIISIVWGLGMLGIGFSSRTIGRRTRALMESEERYRLQFHQNKAVMLIIDPDSGDIVDANPAACAYYGYACEKLLTLKISDINTASPEELAGLLAGVRDGSRMQFQGHHRLADGSVRDVEVSSNPLDFQGKILLHSIVYDITDRLAAERALRDKMLFAESLVLNSTTPTFVIDAGHRVLIWNRALEELTGVPAAELVGTDSHWRAFYGAARPCLADLVIDGTREDLSRLYQIWTPSRLIPDGIHAEGDYILANRRCRLMFSAAPIRDASGTVIAAIQTLEDITERIALENQLVHAQKMESVGTLAGGIAHDFNNILTVISGYGNLLQLTLKNDPHSLQFVGEILDSVDRASEMTRSLLAFSGRQEMQLQYDDVNVIVTRLRKSLTRLIREDITLSVEVCEGALPVFADRVQIEQVLINLVVNARDALAGGGSIKVGTALELRREERLLRGEVMPPGRYAVITISDTGSGMDEETQEHIFEPFFTTKEKGKGTGLGLSIVHGIVGKHKGFVTVCSSPGSGTAFSVYLPLFCGEAPQMSPVENQPLDLHGQETVLLVEDDAALMKLNHEVLVRHGYTVVCASDGIAALEAFRVRNGAFDAAIIDVSMPRMNGRELVEAIRNERPDLPIILTSGYTDDVIDRAGIEALKVVFLQKPVKPMEMLAALRNCITA